ncbi:transglutaminase-like domain-containing protein [Herbiconiux moechotypicola]|uniref:Transglutaminase-like domain-containing protein n=1 Tax=Herbiconiux moechotypicola TaxID=637393 RepID=A0ABN3DCR8_9MICO
MRPAWAKAVDCGVLAALLVIGVLGFGPAFGGSGYLVAGVGGIVLGLALGVAGALLRWNGIVLTAVALGVYLVFGGPLAAPGTTILGVVPTLDTLRTLVLGLVFSWKDVLTLVTPVGQFDSVLVVPFVSALVTSVVAVSLALRLRPSRAAWALVPAAALLVTGIAFGTREAAFPAVLGLVFVGLALCWAAWRRQDARAWAARETAVGGADGSAPPAGNGTSARRTRLAAAAGMVVAALAAGFVAGGLLVPATAREVLRDHIEPPLDLHDYASPLVGFRSVVRDQGDESLFEVTGLPDGARIRLATLDGYDGTVYDVAGDGSNGSGQFVRVSSDIANDAEGERTTLEVSITGLDGVWLPDAGQLDSLEFTDGRVEQLEGALHYNAATGTALDTAGLAEGDSYTLETVLPPVFNDEQLSSRAVSSVTLPRASGVPDDIGALAAEYVADAETPVQQVRNIAAGLAADGFFSHGLEGEAVSRAGHGAERIASLVGAEQMVGDDEQYAVTMALMVRSLGMPARVVMGFYPSQYAAAGESLEITGDDVHAWVEVPFDGAGWVAFDPTPPEDQVPLDEAPQPKSDPKAQVLQPPPPPQEPAELPPDIRTEDTAQDEVEEEGFDYLPVFLAAGGVLGLLIVVFGPLVVIALVKLAQRRRRRRAPRAADRVSGGWDEIVDRAGDLGSRTPAGATRRDDARQLSAAYPTAGLVAVAERADGTVFGPGEPTAAEVEQYWTEVDAAVRSMTRSTRWWRRIAARWSVRSLARRSRERRQAARARRAAARTARTGDDQ